MRKWLREVKWFWQRGTRGYSDRDLWSLDCYLAEWLPAALRHLKDHKPGVPAELIWLDEDGNSTNVDAAAVEWRGILETMALGFEAHYRVVMLDYTDEQFAENYAASYLEKDKAASELGLKLFAHWFGALWD